MATPSNLLRLVPLQLAELPSHPALKLSVHQKGGRGMSPAGGTQLQSTDPQKTTSEPDTPEADRCPPMLPFIKAILDAAVVFIDDTLPTTFEPHSNKSSTPAKTRVELLQRNISAKELSKVDWQGFKIPRHPPDNVASEAWFARRSRHANQQAKGTANFSEFDYGLRIDHCQHEGDYTPEVYDTFKVLEWKIPDALAKAQPVFEMCHKLPFPLSTRVFPVLVITATTGEQDFIVVQLPVEIGTIQEAFYSNGRNLTEGSSALKRKRPIMGFASRLY
ncbi:MAG: hypothetical protein L6R42_007402 [Xanthoria sp. 1 TBL-2021]|nr:MAG: hypothetical protein L6R42_007402 [Xanthoria sp. 1 TBL-2021]